jgi:hypothetical protein
MIGRSAAWGVGGVAVMLLALWLLCGGGGSLDTAGSSPSAAVSPAAAPVRTGPTPSARAALRSSPASGAPAPPAVPAEAGSADPTSPAYDPVMLSRTMEATPGELFAAEPRVEAFAGARERALRGQLAEQIRKAAPELSLTTRIECRTLSCAVEIASPSPLPDDDVNRVMGVFHGPPIADALAFSIPHDDDTMALRVYLQFSPEGRPSAGGYTPPPRRPGLADWNGFVLDHPTEASGLINAIFDEWSGVPHAVFAACKAPARTMESPSYTVEGEVVLDRRRATITGWACLRAPPAEQAMCECVASRLPAETSVEIEHGDSALGYRGGISILL